MNKLRKYYSTLKTSTFLQGIENPVFTRIKEKIQLDSDTFILKFEIPEDQILGVPIGQYIKIFDKEGQKAKYFTPISENDKKGEFDILIKNFYPCEEFPEGGKFSKYLNSLKINDFIKIIGPFGKLEYLKNGVFSYGGKERKFKKVFMLGGGTRILPLYQILKHIVLENQNDILEVKLLFANFCQGDIFMKDELEKFNNFKNIKTDFIVETNESEKWNHFIGLIDEKFIRRHSF